MLLSAGIGLLIAGVILALFNTILTKNRTKAALMKRQGPWIAALGGVFVLVHQLVR